MVIDDGGHLRGPAPHFQKRDWQLCDENVLESPALPVPMEAGDVLMFDSLLPHGTASNDSPDHRWALQFHYTAAAAPQPATCGGAGSGSSSSPGSSNDRLMAFGGEGKGLSC